MVSTALEIFDVDLRRTYHLFCLPRSLTRRGAMMEVTKLQMAFIRRALLPKRVPSFSCSRVGESKVWV